jgi:hypothetical protein
MTFSLKKRQLPTTNLDHPSTSIRKGTEYILLRAKSGKNEPLPDSINQQPSQLPSQSKPFHKPAAPSQRPNPNHFKKEKRDKYRREKENPSRLRPPLPIPKLIDNLSLHLTPLSKEDFGRVSRTFIHNGVVVSYFLPTLAFLLSSNIEMMHGW